MLRNNGKEIVSNMVDGEVDNFLSKLQVMDKELKAIVWLGALLGLVMGCKKYLFDLKSLIYNCVVELW